MALKIQVRQHECADGKITETWRLIIRDFTTGKERCLYPPKHKYFHYGLNPDASVAEAKEQLVMARAKNRILKVAEHRAKVEHRINKENTKKSAYLPDPLYQRYLLWLMDRRLWTVIPPKSEIHLRRMRQLILDIQVDPTEWTNHPEKIYRWFLKERHSLSYIKKILPLLNAYGYFYCRELGKPYLNVMGPRGDIARRIDDVNRDDRQGRQEESKPIGPDKLKKLEDLKPEQVYWLRKSVYFGLRPLEIDKLTPGNRDKFWKITKDAQGTTILNVYQPKLIKVPKDRRWKRIPCILPEQRELAREIQLGRKSQRPLRKNIQARLGANHGLYGGRKNFDKLMRAHGQQFINISRWLGHQDVRQTERSYRETEAVEYDIKAVR